MANNKKLVEAITSMEDDFAQWYTDVVKKAELCGYTSVKGCMAIKPAGYAIWENIQHELDRRFKETGVQNVYMPIFIPESLLQTSAEIMWMSTPDLRCSSTIPASRSHCSWFSTGCIPPQSSSNSMSISGPSSSCRWRNISMD